MIRFLFFLCVIFLAVDGQSQETDVVVRFENLSVQDRLPSHRVLCLCQDQRGFMWFGTEEGLCRYDGYNFVEFFADINKPYSLRNNAIRAIVEDQFGNLWIGTDGGGLHYFDQQTWRFYSYPLPFQKFDNPHSQPGSIYAILRTSDEDFWIGSYGQGLYALPKYSSPSEVLKYCEHGKPFGITQILPTNESDGLNDPNVFCLYEDSEKTIWVGTDDYGSDNGGALHKIVSTDQKSGKYSFKKYRSDSSDLTSLGSNYIMSMYEDSHGRFWICNWEGGLNLLDRETGRFTKFRGQSTPGGINSDDVYSLTEDINGNLWVATYGGGVSRIVESESKTLKFVPYYHEEGNPNSLIGNYVRQIFRSQSGLLWAITWKSGISRIRVTQNPFTQIPLPNHSAQDTISEVVQDMRTNRSGDLSLYTEEQGFMKLDFHQDSDTWAFSKIAEPDDWPQEAIYQTELGREFSGLALFETIVANTRIFCEDTKGNLWIGKNTSLVKISEAKIGEIKIDSFARDSRNPNTLKGFQITGIVEDQSGRIWISTFDALNYFDDETQSFNYLTMKDGLPGNAISGMLIDDTNFIWLATDKGLARFDPISLVSQNYHQNDGMPFVEFAVRSGYGLEEFQNIPAFVKLLDGRLVFSSIQHGLLVFHPNEVFRDLTAPRTWITELRILNKLVDPENIFVGLHDGGHEISFAKNIVLGRRDQSFSFAISVLDYFAPDNTRFAYRLKPLDEEWHYMGDGSRLLTFSLLPPGEYEFEVRGANSDGIWNSNLTTLNLHIPAPWWSRYWFKFTAIVFIFLIVMVLSIRAKQRSQILHALNLERFRREEQDKFTQMRMRFYTNVTHEFRTPLTLILGPLGKLEKFIGQDADAKSDLSIMKRNGLRLLNLVNQLMDFRKIETKALQLQVESGNISTYLKGICELFGENIISREIKFSLVSKPQDIQGYFDRSAIDKIVFNLLSNAFKYTEKQGLISVNIEGYTEPIANLSVSVLEPVEWVRICIKDSGTGIPEQLQEKIFERFYQVDGASHGFGIGLSIVHSFTKMHKGMVSLRSIPGAGSAFTVEIPIDRRAYVEKEVSDRSDQGGADFSIFRPSIIRQLDQESNVSLDSSKNRSEILVVEDNVDMLSFIEGILNNEFFVRTASSAEVALRIIDDHEPDSIITDIMMPGIGGFELVKQLKSDERFSHIPITIISSLESNESELKGLHLGAEDYIRKPFHPEVLLVRIQNQLRARQQFHERFAHQGTSLVDHPTVSKIDQDFLNELLEKIDGHYNNSSFTVKELVDHMGMSHSVLFRKVKSLTGQNLNELIVMIRLEKAHELLRSDKIPIKEVAYQVGFSDPKYFSTRFKKKYGRSPSAIDE